MCKERYINPFTDFGFKKLFGTVANKVFLIRFLNSLLDLEDKIVDITYRNVEHLGMLPDNRSAIFDLYCTTEMGSHIIVEMQNGYQRFFIDRSIYYSTFPMHEEAKRGDWDFQLPRIYTVAFLNFNMSDYLDDPNYKHEVVLVDRTTDTVFYNKLTYIYLEMKKFDKEIDLDAVGALDPEKDPDQILDVWLYVIKNLDKFDEVPVRLRNSLFERFFREAEVQAFTPNERVAYEQSLKYLRDYNNTIATAMEVGVAQGIEKGIAKGMEKGMELGIEKGMAEGIEKGMAEGIEKGMAEGIEKGMAEGIEKGMAEGIEKGMAEGIEKGMAEGIEKGMAEGIEKGMAEGIEKGMAEGIEKGMAEGIEKGMAEGIEKGMAEGIKQVALRMKSQGLTVEVIAETTGLPVSEIEKLV